MSIKQIHPKAAGPDTPVDDLNQPIIIIGHGGGSLPFNSSHPLALLAFQLSFTVYAFRLPFHGLNDEVDRFRMSACENDQQRREISRQILEQVYQAISTVVKNRYVILIGYSTSGLFFLKLFHRLISSGGMNPNSILISIGSALAIGESAARIQAFWSDNITGDPKRHAAMKAFHRSRARLAAAAKDGNVPPSDGDDDWRECLQFVGFVTGHPDSGMFLTAEEKRMLFTTPILNNKSQNQTESNELPQPHRVFMIQAPKDEPFPAQDCVIDRLREVEATLPASVKRDLVQERVRLIEGGNHFNYLTPQAKGGKFEVVTSKLIELLTRYGDPQFLRLPSTSSSSPSRTISSNATAASTSNSTRHIIIIGSGVFGLSTARSLLQRCPDVFVTVLEASSTFPSAKAASVDTNRIVRPDYGSDYLYTEWTLQSITRWRELNRRWGEEVYTETGVLFLTQDPMNLKPTPSTPLSFEEASFQTLQSPPFSLPLMPLQSTPQTFAKHFPLWFGSQTELREGYYQPHGGYVNSGRVICCVVDELQQLYPTRFTLKLNSRVMKLETTSDTTSNSSKISGVRLTNGQLISGDFVISACGAWTTELLPELKTILHPSAQPVIYVRPGKATRQENPDLASKVKMDSVRVGEDYSIYQDAPSQLIAPNELSIPSTASSTAHHNLITTPFPVFSFDLSKLGWYGFAMDSFGLVKIGHHGPGLELPNSHQGPSDSRVLSAAQLDDFAAFLKRYLPHLYAHGSLVEAKTCYYMDSFDGHFLLDFHPQIDGLFVAGGGSGHGFKFFPIIGDVIVNSLIPRWSLSNSSPSSLPAYEPRLLDRFHWRSPATVRSYDICRSPGVSKRNHTPTDSSITQSTFVQSVEHYLLATQQVPIKAKL